jgi:hypothetical protein
MCPLLYPLFACPGFSIAASYYFGLPFFLLRLTVLDMPGLLQTHINFPRFLPIFPDFLERLSHLAPIY